jgi:hypothetical protein
LNSRGEAIRLWLFLFRFLHGPERGLFYCPSLQGTSVVTPQEREELDAFFATAKKLGYRIGPDGKLYPPLPKIKNEKDES